MRVSFLTPRLPPAVCGVGDHTRFLARAMADQGVEIGFIHRDVLQPGGNLPEGPVDRWLDTPASLVDCVARQRPDWLWIQLSGYGYSRWGAPFALARAVKAVRCALPELRVATYFHETHCDAGQLGMKGWVLSPWQRKTCDRIAQLSDRVLTSNLAYYDRIRQSYRLDSSKIALLPIGSNIPLARQTPEERAGRRAAFGWRDDETVAVTFGSWGVQVRTLKLHLEFLASAMRAGTVHHVVCVGGDSPQPPLELNDVRRSACFADRLTVFGPQPAERVAEILAACDLGLAEPPRELLSKSSAFMAMIVNGLPVITAGGGDPGYGLDQMAGCIRRDRLEPETLSKPRLASWGVEMAELAARTFAWDRTARSALSYLARKSQR